MGSGSSRSKVERFDKGNQASSNTEGKSHRSSSPAKSLVFKCFPSESIKRQAFTQDDIFQLDPNIEEYSTIWNHDTKLSSTFEQSIKSNRSNLEDHQKETLNTKRSKKTSTTFDSAHIESTVDTETHSCISLSSSNQIDELVHNLNQIHTQLDEIIKGRTDRISIETESMLSHILHETHEKQQRLLNYAKEQQLKQDEHYRKILQDYLSQLDQIKVQNLADRQNQLQIYRNEILDESQMKITRVNEQANSIKAQILRDEQRKAAEKIDLIIVQLQQLSNDNRFHPLGSESITRTRIITNAHVGTKASGQNDAFHFDSENFSEQRPQANPKPERITKRVSITQKSKLSP